VRTSLIISTYNREDALDLVLKSVSALKVHPHEVIIADDGSGPKTAELIHRHQKSFPISLIHCHQEDKGFRLSHIRNKATALSSGDHLIFIDGDMLVHPYFVHDHRIHAREGLFIQGSRVLLHKETTLSSIQHGIHRYSPFSKGITNRFNALRIPFLSPIISSWMTKQHHHSVRGCNMSFMRNDLIKVNGFNEAFIGWGREDSECVIRLLQAGIQRFNLRLGAIAYHLWHKENINNELLHKNNEELRLAIEEHRIWCAEGLQNHMSI
jgi:glycosyltransferase involved in cell wall biosynthesis